MSHHATVEGWEETTREARLRLQCQEKGTDRTRILRVLQADVRFMSCECADYRGSAEHGFLCRHIVACLLKLNRQDAVLLLRSPLVPETCAPLQDASNRPSATEQTLGELNESLVRANSGLRMQIDDMQQQLADALSHLD